LTIEDGFDIILFAPQKGANFSLKNKKNKLKKLLTETATHDSIYELLLRATTKRRLITEQ